MSDGPTPREPTRPLSTAMPYLKGAIVGALSAEVDHLGDAGHHVYAIHVEGPEERPVIVVELTSGRFEITVAQTA